MEIFLMEFKIDDSIGFIVSRTNGKLKNTLFQRFKQYDVTPEQWVILNRLWEKDGIPQKQLSAQSFKDQPNITRILDKLEKKGYISRGASIDDRRSYLVYLTDEGKRLKEVLVPIAIDVIKKALTGFDEAEIKQIKLFLNRIYNNL